MTDDKPPQQQRRPATTELPPRRNIIDHVRPDVRSLAGYSTGEQQPGFIKLNTNECAYPPSPNVEEALARISVEALRLYPDPTSRRLRETAAARFAVRPDQIIAGNGSDDCLTIAYRTFLSPGDGVCCPWPSYGLYDTLAGIQGSNISHVGYRRSATEWELPDELAGSGARLTLIANPNNPSSTLTPVAELRRLADRLDGILVIDEAYVDFALGADPLASILPHLDAHPNLVVLRTFSKSYSLAGARLGLMFASELLVAQMNKVKDSYNVNVVTQAMGAEALRDRDYHAKVISRTLEEKARLERELTALGWTWPRAWGNFLLCQVGSRAAAIARGLRDAKILVRYWDTPDLRESVRVTVGNADQNTALLTALGSLRSV
jgi:histidinol-phosphate aminotransferase